MKETIEYQNIHENRKYKDTLFRMVFKEKQHLLDLHNAVNGTAYEDPEELEINTLENVLYISMKNDVSLRKYKKESRSLKKAITLAIDECIEKGILLDILTKERNEVLAVVLETFNKELYEKNLKADAYEEGIKDNLIKKIKIKLAKGKSVEQIADELEESVEEIKRLIKDMEKE